MIVGELFGPVWFFYRKSYLYGFLLVIANVLLGVMCVKLGFEKIYLITGIIYFCYANKIYISDVRRKVNKIKNENTEKGTQELIQIVRKKGGTSVVGIILYIFTLLVVIVLLILYEFINNPETSVDTLNNIKSEQIEKEKTPVSNTNMQLDTTNKETNTQSANITPSNNQSTNNQSTNTSVSNNGTLKQGGTQINVSLPSEYTKTYDSQTMICLSNESLKQEVTLGEHIYATIEDYVKNDVKFGYDYKIGKSREYKNLKMSDIAKVKAKNGREYIYVKINYNYESLGITTEYEEVYAITQINKDTIYSVKILSTQGKMPDNVIRKFLDIKTSNY